MFTYNIDFSKTFTEHRAKEKFECISKQVWEI